MTKGGIKSKEIVDIQGVSRNLEHLSEHILKIIDSQISRQKRLEFADDITAMMHTSWYSPFKEHRLVVTGNLGSIVFDDGKPIQEKLTLYRDRVIDEGETIKIERNKPIFMPVSSDEPLKNEISAFIQVCKSGEPALTDIEEALRVQQILSEMNLQINGGKL